MEPTAEALELAKRVIEAKSIGMRVLPKKKHDPKERALKLKNKNVARRLEKRKRARLKKVLAKVQAAKK